MQYNLIIGADFLRTVEIIVKKGEVLVSRPSTDPELPEIFQIDYAYETDKLGVAHLDVDYRNTLDNMIRNYMPNKTRDVDVKMRLVLKDN